MTRSATTIAVFILVALGCERSGPSREPTRLVVFAASSLTEAFEDLATVYVQMFGEPEPILAFAGSQILRLQIEQGARAHVFASANAAHMQSLAATGRIARPRVFAYNELVVIVPRSNPASIDQFSDLSRARRIVIGTPDVPVGAYTREMLVRAEEAYGAGLVSELRSNIVSEESNARLVRAKVELGEADAAVVYRTDLSPRVRVIELPAELSVRAAYHAALVGEPPYPEAATRWISLLESARGRAILREHGFSTP
jgi:molybdate transport system substrate-binding protein